MTEIHAWVAANIAHSALADLLLALPTLAGDKTILVGARTRFAAVAPAAVEAVDQLLSVATTIEQRYPEVEMYFDLSELRGYHYLTGLVFAAFAPGYGNPIASGGRYDHIGEVFGRARPATGFAVDITALSKLGLLAQVAPAAILAITADDPRQWQAIQLLRTQGERVISVTNDIDAKELGCNRQLVLTGDGYQVVSL
jgi:ATP phosphoribosyltransferase regulatory subunit